MNFLEKALDGQNQFVKYLAVVLAGFLGGQLIGAMPLGIVVMIKSMANNGVLGLNSANVTDLTSIGLSRNATLVLMLLPFVTSLILTVFLIQWLHKRTFAESINGTKKIRWNRVFSGIAVWGVLLLLSSVADYWMDPENYVFQLNWHKFIVLTLISLCMIPLQTTFEELFFRGYLTQGIAGWTKSRWLAILIPGILFGLMHVANPEINEFGFWQAMPNYILFGLLFGLISILDDGIELAIGIHAINNIFTCLTTTYSASALQTDALFHVQHVDPASAFIPFIIICGIAVAYFAVRYKWNFKILNQKVEIQQIEETNS